MRRQASSSLLTMLATFEWQLVKQTLKTGFPMALQQFIVSFGFVFIQRAVNSYSEAMTASYFTLLGLFQGENNALFSTFGGTRFLAGDLVL